MPRIYRSAVIAAPAERVWAALRDFHDLGWAAGVVDSCEAVGERRGDQVGARRILNGVFHETLLALDDRARTTRYRVDDGPSPVSAAEVSDFVAEIRVRPVADAGGAFVEWSARWEAADDAAREFAGGIYTALLEALGRSVGAAPSG